MNVHPEEPPGNSALRDQTARNLSYAVELPKLAFSVLRFLVLSGTPCWEVWGRQRGKDTIHSGFQDLRSDGETGHIQQWPRPAPVHEDS